MTTTYLDRSMAVVIVHPGDTVKAFSACLVKLDAKGQLDFKQEIFQLIHTNTRDEAADYALKLSRYLGVRRFEVGPM